MYTNIVIAGGGLRTVPVIGTLQFLEELDQLSKIKKYFGTSMGGLFCLLLNLNYTINEIKDILLNFDTNKLFNKNININNIFETFNIYSNSNFEKFIKLLIKYKGINSEITLLELYNLTNKILTCASVSITSKEIEYINYTIYPDLPVYKLVLMTTAIPFIFEPIEWLGNKYVDGGIVDNFPLYCIPVDEIENTLGINTVIKFSKTSKINNIVEYIYCILNIATLVKNIAPLYKVINLYIEEKYSNDLINLSASKEEIELIIKRGYDSTKEYFHESQTNL